VAGARGHSSDEASPLAEELSGSSRDCRTEETIDRKLRQVPADAMRLDVWP
jgi:hypothetical protein